MNTLNTLTQYAQGILKDTYAPDEIRTLCKIIFTDVFNYTNIDIHLKKDEYLEKSFADKFHSIIICLKSGKPIQYILGHCEFGDLDLQVDSHVLIPRPETEELVAWITENIVSGSHILDIGTGSGCIAILLAHRFPACRVDAIDIHPPTLETAKRNALKNQQNIDFSLKDILHFEEYAWPCYDVIISNPPYVRNMEKKEMHPRVLDHEPHRALFVPDEDPLIFYRKICDFGKEHLSSGGKLFFEINEALGRQTVELIDSFGYRDIILKKDLFNKDRFIMATNP